jgi:hypothetical protein
MADVNIQQSPDSGGSGGTGVILGVLLIIVVLLAAWLVFGRGVTRHTDIKVDINTPAASSGGGGGATKTP